MNKDLGHAQANTLREWADQWERDARIVDASGSNEVAYLMRRAARVIGACLGDAPLDADVAPAEPVAAELKGG